MKTIREGYQFAIMDALLLIVSETSTIKVDYNRLLSLAREPRKPSPMTIHNLPYQATPFLGRDRELAEIAKLLTEPACKLLTLVGPGGIGKTRLSLEVARNGEYGEATHYIALQGLTSPDLIVPAIAQALGFQFYAGDDTTQQLLDYLHDKSLLLVLDNLEHLLEGVGLVGDILSAAPPLKMLATSR